MRAGRTYSRESLDLLVVWIGGGPGHPPQKRLPQAFVLSFALQRLDIRLLPRLHDPKRGANHLTLASQCIGTAGEWSRPHVTPGVYSSSYLFSKMAGGPYCLLTNGELSAPMPLDHAIPGDAIDSIRDWINEGAPSD